MDPNEVCDEIQCRSSGFYGGNDCWAYLNGTESDYLCTDGNVGVALLSIDPVTIPGLGFFQYYTCCQLSSGINVNETLPPDVQAQCSPSWEPCTDINNDCIADGPFEPMTCDDPYGVYNYPQKTGSKSYFYSWWYSQYRCCSAPPLTSEKENMLIPETFRFALGIFGFCMSSLLILAILLNKPVRRQSFNLYMLFLALPDAFALNLIAATVGGMTIFGEGLENACSLLNFFGIFYAASNLWLNAIVAAEIFCLLRKSKQRKRTRPPSNKKVMLQSLGVYALGVASGVWMIYVQCRYIFTCENRLAYGLTWAVIAGPPFFVLSYVCFKVWRGGLLPRSGRTRVLAFYFARIITIFFLFWILAITLANLEPANKAGLNGCHYGYWYLGNLNSVLNVAFACTKPDLKNAILQLLVCKCSSTEDGENSPFQSGLSGTLKKRVGGSIVFLREERFFANKIEEGVEEESPAKMLHGDPTERVADGAKAANIKAEEEQEGVARSRHAHLFDSIAKQGSEWENEDQWSDQWSA